jgi:hypothetical protein
MKITSVRNLKNAGAASLLLWTLPGLAAAHPGHGLDGLWVHGLIHGVTVVLAISLVALLIPASLRAIRHRRQKNRH